MTNKITKYSELIGILLLNKYNKFDKFDPIFTYNNNHYIKFIKNLLELDCMELLNVLVSDNQYMLAPSGPVTSSQSLYFNDVLLSEKILEKN
jgi:hypothetical protein